LSEIREYSKPKIMLRVHWNNFRQEWLHTDFLKLEGYQFGDPLAPVIHFELLLPPIAICTRYRWLPQLFRVKFSFLTANWKKKFRGYCHWALVIKTMYENLTNANLDISSLQTTDMLSLLNR